MDAMKAAIVYPSVAREAGIQGRVIVQFVVDETGAVTDPFIVRGIGGGADEEAIRVVRMMRFTPGTQRGQAVKVQMTLPVTFRLSGEETGATPSRTASDLTAYDEVDQTPKMLPNQKEAMDAMQAAIVYPAAAREAEMEGRVIVQFIVDEQGVVTDPFVVRGMGAEVDDEAMRVIRTLRFEPAEKDGKTVKVRMTLPVTFRLDGSTRSPFYSSGSMTQRHVGLLRAWKDVSQYSAPYLITTMYGGPDSLAVLAAALREVRSDLPLAIVAGSVGASGTRNIRVIESDCHLQRNAICRRSFGYQARRHRHRRIRGALPDALSARRDWRRSRPRLSARLRRTWKSRTVRFGFRRRALSLTHCQARMEVAMSTLASVGSQLSKTTTPASD